MRKTARDDEWLSWPIKHTGWTQYPRMWSYVICHNPLHTTGGRMMIGWQQVCARHGRCRAIKPKCSSDLDSSGDLARYNFVRLFRKPNITRGRVHADCAVKTRCIGGDIAWKAYQCPGSARVILPLLEVGKVELKYSANLDLSPESRLRTCSTRSTVEWNSGD